MIMADIPIDRFAHLETLVLDQGIRKRWNAGTAFQGRKDFVRPTRYWFPLFCRKIQNDCDLRLIDILIFNRPGVAGAVL